MITSFSGDYAFLSNFHPSEVTFDTVRFPTVEHAFVAAKCMAPYHYLAVLACMTPGAAKRLGRKADLRSDWNEVRDSVMANLVMQKFQTHLDLREKLFATGDQELIEGNNWGDRYWGMVNGEGQNKLGVILMQTRSHLRLLEAA